MSGLGSIGFAFLLVTIINKEVAKTNTGFLLFIGILVGVVAIFVTGVIFDLAQVFITLLLIFFDNNSVTTNGGSIENMVLLTIAIQMKIFFDLI